MYPCTRDTRCAAVEWWSEDSADAGDMGSALEPLHPRSSSPPPSPAHTPLVFGRGAREPLTASHLHCTAGSSRSSTALRKGARLCCGPRLRKGEVFAYVGLPQNLKDLKAKSKRMWRANTFIEGEGTSWSARRRPPLTPNAQRERPHCRIQSLYKKCKHG